MTLYISRLLAQLPQKIYSVFLQWWPQVAFRRHRNIEVFWWGLPINHASQDACSMLTQAEAPKAPNTKSVNCHTKGWLYSQTQISSQRTQLEQGQMSSVASLSRDVTIWASREVWNHALPSWQEYQVGANPNHHSRPANPVRCQRPSTRTGPRFADGSASSCPSRNGSGTILRDLFSLVLVSNPVTSTLGHLFLVIKGRLVLAPLPFITISFITRNWSSIFQLISYWVTTLRPFYIKSSVLQFSVLATKSIASQLVRRGYSSITYFGVCLSQLYSHLRLPTRIPTQ